MTEQNINNLEEIKSLLKSLSKEQYNKNLPLLSNAFIGQHVRHILEFYQCLFHATENKHVDYGERKRDLKLETDPQFAILTIEVLQNRLSKIKNDFQVAFMANFTLEEEEAPEDIPSSFYRELAFNLDHSIHHQALIRVALKELNLSHLINENFGFAPSSLRFIKKHNLK